MPQLIRHRHKPYRRMFALTWLTVLLIGSATPWATADPATSTTRFARVLEGSNPRSLEELKEIQRRIQSLTAKILPATVAIQVGRANGSGVIIDEEGHLLTAAHVAGLPGRRAVIHLPSGKTVYGVTLGLNQKMDSGLIKITDPGPWPFAPLGNSTDVKIGQWCLATGHPGGYDPDRPPVLRWGRVLRVEDSAILTDCTLVGGDSGGPLFDLNGRVIGVHSRIGKNLTVNVHVPVSQYTESWDRLLAGEMWGMLDEDESGTEPSDAQATPDVQEQAWLGVVEDRQSTAPSPRISSVVSNSPASRAGLQPGDVILRFDDVSIQSFGQLQAAVRSRQPGANVQIDVRRGDAIIPLHVQLGGQLYVPQP